MLVNVDPIKTLVLFFSYSKSQGVLEPIESDWEPAQVFCEARWVRRADLGRTGESVDSVRSRVLFWLSEHICQPNIEYSPSNSTLHLPHLLPPLHGLAHDSRVNQKYNGCNLPGETVIL